MGEHHHGHHGDEHEEGHGNGHGCKKKMLFKIAYGLVMRCYPDGQLSYDQVKEAAARIHEVKHILKGPKCETK